MVARFSPIEADTRTDFEEVRARAGEEKDKNKTEKSISLSTLFSILIFLFEDFKFFFQFGGFNFRIGQSLTTNGGN